MEKGFGAAEGCMSPLTLDSHSPMAVHDDTVGAIVPNPSLFALHIKVINAMDGLQHDLDLSARASIHSLRQALVLKTGVPVDDQILLHGPPYARLDPKKSIESYNLPNASTSIFLYDRRILSLDKPPAPRIVLQPQNVHAPAALPSSPFNHSKLLQETSSPLLRALFDYESQFQQQVLMAEAVESTAIARLAATEACVEQLEHQSRAIQAALSNLDTHHVAMQARFTPFWSDFQHTSADHTQLLENFDTYVNRLQTIPLHPALATATRSTLLDCIPLDRERDWFVSCQQSQKSIQSKMEGLATTYRSVSDAITLHSSNTLNGHASVAVPLDGLRRKIDECAANIASISSMRQSLRQNYDAVVKRVADTTQQTLDEVNSMPATTSMNTSFMFGSTHILEACRGLDELFRQQADVLPSMQRLDDDVKIAMNSVAKIKEEFFSVVCAKLKLVSELQSSIVEFETHLGILKDALAYQKLQFAELKHIELLPHAYEACVAEIKRRRQYGRIFQLRINEMGQAMVAMREAEIAKREAFLRDHGQHLPRDFAPGLTEKPSHCIVSMRPFDTNLPGIEEDNVEDPPNELQLLKQRCHALERQVETLQQELDDQHKASCHCDDSYSNSSSLSASVETGPVGPKFPLVLALAATAGHSGTMNNSSEMLKENDTVRRLKDAVYEKDSKIGHLEDANSTLHDTVRSLQFSMGMQRNWLKKVVSVLNVENVELDSAEGLHECLMHIEDKWKDCTAAAVAPPLAATAPAAPDVSVSSDADASSKIAFRSFSYNDLALFLPTFAPTDVNAPKIYLAFHLGCPNRFLSDESITTYYQMNTRYPEYILGRIVFIDERVASERDNPYRLIAGTTFFVLTVTFLVDF
ncbi:hypothetical protein, variant [Aphanomyces invadans]|uniref:Ubiquitin-like domain-containing protein n=1 Tax=Aphanomyces invadans TaxID=157072 RepID=A0A024UIF8_9STRA|nr:hypothetical protein, variant [Aphanomyces invadans]ETW05950.1 hypothetical protein, variant [Aphanomyces invadans]|eukprot:XP_008865727.1 hypothetical protein, variant [Aphanomyces invadans]